MGWFQELLDELYDVKNMYCKDCKRGFKTRKKGLLASKWDKAVSKRCVYCDSVNTQRTKRLVTRT